MPKQRDLQLFKPKSAWLRLVLAWAAVASRGIFDFTLGDSYPFTFSFVAIAVAAAYRNADWRPWVD